jgi:hypothetical protein
MAEVTRTRTGDITRGGSDYPMWRWWATRHPVAASALAGLSGVHVASVLGFWFGQFGLTRLD